MSRQSLKNEIWRDIEGYEGSYQVSNLGRVKSLFREAGTVNKKYTCKEKILKPRRQKRDYYAVMLWKDGKSRQFRVHRLVAQAFIPNPDNLPVINHKDENPSNNEADNLEWCTVKYNSYYGTCRDKIRQKRLGTHHTEETKRLMSSQRKGENNGMYGKHHSNETKQLQSEIRKEYYRRIKDEQK